MYRRGIVCILVYVDDILLVSGKEYEVLSAKKETRRHVNVKNMGHLKIFQGVRISKNQDGACRSKNITFHPSWTCLAYPVTDLGQHR